MDLMTVCLASFIVCIGSMIQGSVGIGLGFVAVPLLVLLEPRFVPGPLLLAALFLTLMVSFREYRSIDRRGIKWARIGRLFGTVFAAYLLTIIPQDQLGLLFAAIIILAVSMMEEDGLMIWFGYAAALATVVYLGLSAGVIVAVVTKLYQQFMEYMQPAV